MVFLKIVSTEPMFSDMADIRVIWRLIYINYAKDITGFCNGKITIVYFLNTFSCSNFARSLLTFDWKEVFPLSDSLYKIWVWEMPWSLWPIIMLKISSCLFPIVDPVTWIMALLILSPLSSSSITTFSIWKLSS